MRLTRRHLPFVAVPLLIPAIAIAQRATPEATPTALSPEAMLEALLTSPIATPLFPADTGTVVVSEWDDPGDTDLDGAVGGVLFTVEPSLDNLVGVAIVFPDAATAAARLQPADEETEGEPTRTITIAGLNGFSSIMPIDDIGDGATGAVASLVTAGNILINGIAFDESLPGLELRSLAHLVALIDHIQRVTGAGITS